MTVVLDASAVLALLHDEPGAERVVQFLDDARLSAVNHAEVLTILGDAGVRETVGDDMIDSLQIAIEPFSRAQAVVSAQLRSGTKAAGLSLGDRACLALADVLGVPAVTADRAWGGLPLGIEVRLIR